MIHLRTYNWSTGRHEQRPIHEPILQEIVDTLFRVNVRIWEEDPEHFATMIRRWQQRLFAAPVPPEPAPAPEPEPPAPKEPTAAQRAHRDRLAQLSRERAAAKRGVAA